MRFARGTIIKLNYKTPEIMKEGHRSYAWIWFSWWNKKSSGLNWAIRLASAAKADIRQEI